MRNQVIEELARATEHAEVAWTTTEVQTLSAELSDGYSLKLQLVPSFGDEPKGAPRDTQPDHVLTILHRDTAVDVIDRRCEELTGDTRDKYQRFKKLWEEALKNADGATGHLRAVLRIVKGEGGIGGHDECK